MIIVTGGAGFIGSAIICELNKRGRDDILAVDSLGTDNRWMNLRGLRFTDYMEKDAFLHRVQKNMLPDTVSAVIHMGACSDTTEKDAGFLISNNFEYTKAQRLDDHAPHVSLVIFIGPLFPFKKHSIHLCIQRSHIRRRRQGIP